MIQFCATFVSMLLSVKADMEGSIVGGSYASIKKFPHSAHMLINCPGSSVYVQCSSSILNQRIMLTAAHCTKEACLKKRKSIWFKFGHADKYLGAVRQAQKVLIHDKYDPATVSYDIALVKLAQPLQFNSVIRRVAIMRKPPYNEEASIAGWGRIQEIPPEETDLLKQLSVRVWRKKDCKKFAKKPPEGTFCASNENENHYVSYGDSGSALVVQGYIQIGIASYKLAQVATNVLIYTDVGYYYDWIERNARILYCL